MIATEAVDTAPAAREALQPAPVRRTVIDVDDATSVRIRELRMIVYD